MEQDAQLLDNNVTAPQCEHDAQEVNAIRLVRIQDESGDGRKTISKEEFQFRNIILLFMRCCKNNIVLRLRSSCQSSIKIHKLNSRINNTRAQKTGYEGERNGNGVVGN